MSAAGTLETAELEKFLSDNGFGSGEIRKTILESAATVDDLRNASTEDLEEALKGKLRFLTYRNLVRSIDATRGADESDGEGSEEPAPKRTKSTSKYTGVWFAGGVKPWAARVNVDGQRQHLGRFDTEDAAGRAYDDASAKIGRPRTNFP
mmetsp:Transcript_25538/g.76683  ORF Transcript_25538/g.76683 Transcript_25538/m.76683 type:complete len:150 (-) Transcript_25538:29-478(-)